MPRKSATELISLFSDAKSNDIKINRIQSCLDFIFANINKNVLIQHVHDLFKCTRENGVLIISGLLRTDYEDILHVFVPVFGPFSKSYYEGDWLAMTFERRV